jgi:hypothetical protein
MKALIVDIVCRLKVALLESRADDLIADADHWFFFHQPVRFISFPGPKGSITRALIILYLLI